MYTIDKVRPQQTNVTRQARDKKYGFDAETLEHIRKRRSNQSFIACFHDSPIFFVKLLVLTPRPV